MPYALVVGDAKAGLVVGAEMVALDPDLTGLLAQVPGRLMKVLAGANARPATLRMAELRLADLVQPACEEVGIEVVLGEAPFIEHLREGLGEFLSGG